MPAEMFGCAHGAFLPQRGCHRNSADSQRCTRGEIPGPRGRSQIIDELVTISASRLVVRGCRIVGIAAFPFREDFRSLAMGGDREPAARKSDAPRRIGVG